MEKTNLRQHILIPVVYIAAIFIIIAGLMKASSIVIPILLSLFFSIIAAQPVLWLKRKKVPYSLAVVIIILLFLIIFLLLGGLISNSLANFSQNVPKYSDNLEGTLNSIIQNLNNLGFTISADQFRDLIDPGSVMKYTAKALGEITSLVSNSLLILIISIFILLEVRDFIFKADVIAMTENRSLQYLDDIGKSIRHYLSIKTVISLITGVLVTTLLLIIGVDYPILWGLIAFLLNYIPSIGSIIAAIPTSLLALIQLGTGGFIWTAVGYLVINTVMGNVVEPKMMGKGLGLSTLIVFLSLIIWGYVFGTIGMFLSIPLTMSIKIILEQREKTRWIAMLLGTQNDAKKVLSSFRSRNDPDKE
jgi:predicted PurR-regulated permease PerM